MKLIISRKGFDSANGRCPSPIFPDGTMFSLPIPLKHEDKFTYGELCHRSETLGEINIGEVVADLTSSRRRISANHYAHMSPALNPPNGWPRLFDQSEASEGHLKKQGVGEGDLFIFFGLFRRVEDTGERWKFIDAKPQHILWGWLQVEAKRGCGEGDEKLRCSCGNANVRYVARKKLDMGKGIDAPGAGVFPRFDKRLLLTEPGQSVSRWKLPHWFHPENRRSALTYHDPERTKSNRWTRKPGDSEYVYLQSVGRGQEFVLDCDHYREAEDWARDLIRDRDFGAR